MDDTAICKEIVDSIGKIQSVLDIGCGDGSLVRFLTESIAQEALGIDIGVDDLRIKVKAPQGRLRRDPQCFKGDVHCMDSFPSNRFDAVVSVRTIHELSHPTAALLEMHRVLKTQGTLFISDFSKGHEGEKIWGEGYYTPDEIKGMLS